MRGSAAHERLDAKRRGRVAGVQAVILAGGEGTRLRPLTSRVPKPVVALVGRPFISYMLDWLVGHGVTEAILCCGFRAERVREVLGEQRHGRIRLRYLEEPTPLGTAGALRYAEELLEERFVLCNGDVLCDFDLREQIAMHSRVGARGTLALAPVEDPSAYGLVRISSDGAVREFVEKPTHADPGENLISAGIYVLERSVLELIAPGRAVSIEHEVWPALVGGGLYGYVARGYWLDIGSPARYLQATADIISGAVATSFVASNANGAGAFEGPVHIAPGAVVEPDARIGPFVVLGEGVRIGAGARVERSVVLEGAQVGERVLLRDCVVGERARIGADTEVRGEAMIGEDALIGSDNVIAAGAQIFPGVVLGDGAIGF